MKEGWTYKKLGEVAFFARGLTYSKNDEVERSNNIVLRSNNIDLVAGKLDFSELKYLKSDFVIPEDKRLRKGSLFICMSNGSKAHLGKVAYVDKDYGYAFGGFMGQITPNNDVDGLFLHYALSSPLYKEYIKSLSEGANINNLKYKDLAEFVIKYPPLSEQQSIVDYLDSAFAKIDAMKANAEKALNEAKALFQATLKEMLEPKEGWEEKKLGEVCVLSQGLAINSHTRYLIKASGKLPLLRIKDMKNGTREIFIDEDNCPKGCIANEDDIIYTRTGTLGLVFTGMRGVLHNNCFKIRIEANNIDNSFFMYYLEHDTFKKSIISLAERAAQPDITHKLFKSQTIYFPLLSVQQSIVATLDSLKSKVDRLQENFDKISQECDALKQAILRQVFE